MLNQRYSLHSALSMQRSSFYPSPNDETLPQMPMILPESSTSIDAARETFGSPGISIMLPEIATTKPAPAESDAFVTLRVQPLGAPRSFGLSESEYCVFAIHTGSFAYPQSENCFSWAAAWSEKFTSAAS